MDTTEMTAQDGASFEIGIDSFAAAMPDPVTGRTVPGHERMAQLMDEIETADQSGVDVFGMGEHHRAEFLDAAPAVILSAAAARTRRIRLTSAVTVLSAADPVRVFQDFATLDLLSKGRAEVVVGRGSFGEAYPLFGFAMQDYDALFAEKLDLLLKLRDETRITWRGQFRAPLQGQPVYPRPVQPRLPVWLGVGGTPQSFVRAGTLGLPLMIAVIGGSFSRFRPLVDLYREAGARTGHSPETLKVGIHALGFVGETDRAARDAFFPGWYQMASTIGRERGWSGASREQFDAMCGPGGAYIVGDPRTVATKVLGTSRELGGISRLTFQMSSAAHDIQAMLRSIELLGREVIPLLRNGTLPSREKTGP